MLAALPALALITAPAVAQEQRPTNLRATIDGVAPGKLQVTERNGDKITLLVPQGTRVTQVVSASPSDITPNSYVGATSIDRNGKSYAVEVHIFPEALRGTGEGSFPYDLQPQSTMTNGTVGAVQGVSGQTVTIIYKGQKKDVLVTPETKVVSFTPGSPADLKDGAHVLAASVKGADGSWTAQRISVGKNGMVPPM
jgi:hypothetical protein